jgi:chorismate dehydratase
VRPRVGHIQFLNSLPLYHMLVRNGSVLDVDLCKDTPAELSRRLLSGALDISPVPAIEYARNAGELRLLPDVAVASDGGVMSILLVSKRPLEELDGKPVALANTSRTSQVLAQILLREKYHIAPRYFPCPPDLPEMFREAEAALLIGDDALRVFARPEGLHVFDLGQEWKSLTGEKMVYAVWAVRERFWQEHPDSVRAVLVMFKRSLRMSLENVRSISSEIARWEPFSAGFLEAYFKALKFDFTRAYQQGLLRYYSMAHAIGALDAVPDLRFIE